jgi:hypothetical protein
MKSRDKHWLTCNFTLKNREHSPRNSWNKSGCYSWSSVTLVNVKTSYSLCSRRDLSLWLVPPIYTVTSRKSCTWESSNIGIDARSSLIIMGMMTGLTSERPKKNRKGTTTTGVAMIKSIKNKKNHMKSKKVRASSRSGLLSGIKHLVKGRPWSLSLLTVKKPSHISSQDVRYLNQCLLQHHL